MSGPETTAIMAFYQVYCYECDWVSPMCETLRLAETRADIHQCEPVPSPDTLQWPTE